MWNNRPLFKKIVPHQKNSLATLYQIIDGFELPLGMELLATVDVLITENKDLLLHPTLLQQEVEKWSERKAHLMKPPYVASTMERLKAFGEELYLL